MGEPASHPMTVDQFLAAELAHPGGPRCELVHGQRVIMAPQNALHVEVKHLVCTALRAAAARAGLACQVFADGMTVRIDPFTAYEPDAVVNGGAPIPRTALVVPEPVIVVEVVSPTSGSRDAGTKLADYVRLPSLTHYLIVRPEPATVIHHRRRGDGTLIARILTEGRLDLAPPGLEVDVAAFFPDASWT